MDVKFQTVSKDVNHFTDRGSLFLISLFTFYTSTGASIQNSINRIYPGVFGREGHLSQPNRQHSSWKSTILRSLLLRLFTTRMFYLVSFRFSYLLYIMFFVRCFVMPTRPGFLFLFWTDCILCLLHFSTVEVFNEHYWPTWQKQHFLETWSNIQQRTLFIA